MLIQTIYKKAIDAGFTAEIKQFNSGKYSVIIDGFNIPDFFQQLEKLYKKAHVHIDYDIYSQYARIMDSADYSENQAYNDNMQDLVNTFWEAIHAGKNQQEAKTSQYEYAVNHNIIDLFNKIYA